MKPKNLNLLPIAVLSILLLIAVCFKSRAFIFSSVIGLGVFAGLSTNQGLTINKIIGLAFLSGVLLFVLTFCLKKDSSIGRMLIYKISWRIFSDSYLEGIGLDKFKVKYGLYQAEYFRNETYSTKEFLLADNVYFAFNDYWQFIIETGLTGLCILIILVYLTIKTCFAAIRAHSESVYLKLAVCIIIIIGVAGLFTHVFERAIFQIISTITLFYIGIKGVNVKHAQTLIVTAVIIASSITAYKLCYKLHLYSAYSKFESAKTLSETGYIRESLKHCQDLFPILKDDEEFLVFYSGELAAHMPSPQAIKMINYTLSKRTNNMLYLRKASVHAHLGNVRLAEEAYIMATSVVPNRFLPKFALFQFYIKNNWIEKARQVAGSILSMPVKVPSEKVHKIKASVSDILANYTKHNNPGVSD